MPVSSPASSPHRRRPTSAFPPFSEPDPDSESRPPSPYGERDPCQLQNNLYTGTPSLRNQTSKYGMVKLLSMAANLYACRDMLANLWVRGAGLQCWFSQERIDLLVPAYHGPIGPDSIFDPSLLSIIVIQIKFKHDGDLNAELAIS